MEGVGGGDRDSFLISDHAWEARSLLLCLEEPETVDDAPDVWPDEAAEEPLEEAHEENVVDEALIADAGADHGADAASERNEVQDGADERWGVLELHDSVSAASGATSASLRLESHLSKFN